MARHSGVRTAAAKAALRQAACLTPLPITSAKQATHVAAHHRWAGARRGRRTRQSCGRAVRGGWGTGAGHAMGCQVQRRQRPPGRPTHCLPSACNQPPPIPTPAPPVPTPLHCAGSSAHPEAHANAVVETQPSTGSAAHPMAMGAMTLLKLFRFTAVSNTTDISTKVCMRRDRRGGGGSRGHRPAERGMPHPRGACARRLRLQAAVALAACLPLFKQFSISCLALGHLAQRGAARHSAAQHGMACP